MIKPGGSACLTCPAQAGKCVLPELSQAPRLVVVGESPSRAELEAGRPLVGASGRMLQRGLGTLGLKRSDVHWTNAILCECPPQELPAARKACQARLTAELAAAVARAPEDHNPVIMPVGAFGLQSSLASKRKPQILKWRGTVTPANFGAGYGLREARPDTGGPKRLERDGNESGSTPPGAAFVCPTIHPAFVMRSPSWAPILELDVARVGRVMRDGFVAPEEQPGRRIIVAQTLSQLEAQCLALAKGPVGFDVETVGLGPTHTSLVCFALSDGALSLVVPWSVGRDGRVPWWPGREKAKALAIINRCLAERVAVTHNGPAFDFIVAERYGIEIAEWDDTLLHAHATASHLPKRLAHVVTQSLDVTAWKEFEDRTATIERLWIYNARDTLYTILRWLAVRHEVAA